MERRKEPRLKANQPVIVSSCGLMPMPQISGRTLDMSGSGLQLRLPNPIPCGSPVKVESDHMVLMGEVTRCQYDAEGGYIVSLMVLESAPSGRTAS
jgi:PilZ domain